MKNDEYGATKIKEKKIAKFGQLDLYL